MREHSIASWKSETCMCIVCITENYIYPLIIITKYILVRVFGDLVIVIIASGKIIFRMSKLAAANLLSTKQH